jgi:hypothetical protein
VVPRRPRPCLSLLRAARPSAPPMRRQRPLLGVKRTWRGLVSMSSSDHWRHSRNPKSRCSNPHRTPRCRTIIEKRQSNPRTAINAASITAHERRISVTTLWSGQSLAQSVTALSNTELSKESENPVSRIITLPLRYGAEFNDGAYHATTGAHWSGPRFFGLKRAEAVRSIDGDDNE